MNLSIQPGLAVFLQFKKWQAVGNSGGVFPVPFEGSWCMKCCFSLLFALFQFAVLPAFAGLKNSDCLDCHADNTLFKTNSAGKAISLFVDAARLKLSAHKTNDCIRSEEHT